MFKPPPFSSPSLAKQFNILAGRLIPFRSFGRSQAVRLPKEFRFEGTEVRVSKVGDKVILEPLQKPPFDVDAWFARLDELGGRDFLPDGIPDEPPAEPDPRVFFDE